MYNSWMCSGGLIAVRCIMVMLLFLQGFGGLGFLCPFPLQLGSL